ncbi:MAG: hypothetical protein KKB38_21090 [Gammaproteobacteria bacterium]|nr:hypothetical protein [Gammaproteobacteria bacterium]
MENESEKIRKVFQGDIPAPQTLEFMQKITETMATINEKLQTLEKGMDKNSDDHRILFDKMDKFIECSNKKYASKEEFQFWRNVVVSGILVAIFLGVIALFLK